MMKVFVGIFITVFLFATIGFASTSQDIEDNIDKLLQKQEITQLANKLAGQKSNTTDDLLLRLSVFSRAGHRTRVHKTLEEIAKIYPTSNEKNEILYFVRKHIDQDDFTAQKIYYEKIHTNGDNEVHHFTKLFREKDVQEFENWLKVRADKSDVWWWRLLWLKKDLGTVNEILDDLERKIRANPNDFDSLQKYLQNVGFYTPTSVMPISVGSGGFSYGENVLWLLDVLPLATAYENYELAGYLSGSMPEIGIELYKKSLSLPFTDKDRKLFGERAFRMASISPNNIDAEKQLRFWTKNKLAQIYQNRKQNDLAQPLIEDLAKMDKNNIQTTDVFRQAGAVQMSTGQRVVEKHILTSEADKKDSHMYWLERAKYYEGRNEKDQVWQAYLQALPRFEYFPNDNRKSSPRINILLELASFGSDYKEAETEAIFRKEFAKAKSAMDADYLFALLYIFNNHLEKLRDEFFVNTEFLPKVLATKDFWSERETDYTLVLMDSEKWTESQKAVFWNKLFDLAMKKPKTRAFSLAEALYHEEHYEKASLLYESVLKFAPEIYVEGLNYTREDIERGLFDSYIDIGNWQKAEKMYLGGFKYWGNELSEIAVTAAKKGAIYDAVRIWKLNANLDRRKLQGLEELAKTDAKTFLQTFYLEMKEKDGLSYIPEKALSILN